MSDIEKAITETVKDQHPVSDFIDNATAPAPATSKKPEKKPKGRPKGSGKNQRLAAQKSFVPDELARQGGGGAESTPFPAPQEDELQKKIELSRKNAATGAAALVQTSGFMLAGEDAKMSGEEFSSIQDGFEKFFEKKGISDFPPGIALGLALGGYYFRIIMTERARPKMQTIGKAVFSAWKWLNSKIGGLFKAKQEVQFGVFQRRDHEE